MHDTQPLNAAQSAMQPFVKLVQANMALLTRFGLPIPSAATAGAEGPIQMMQQGQQTLTRMMQSTALLELMQGLAHNYAEFMREFADGSTALLSQGQETLLRQTRDLSSKVTDAAHTAQRQARSAAA